MRYRARVALLSIALLLTAGLTLAAVQKKSSGKSAAAKKTTAAKKSGTKKKASSASTASKKKKSSARSRTPSQTWRSRQGAPEPERYREIQEALVAKGYLQGPATGQWNQTSVDALRRFQQEQNLNPNGKINSLSLIALGLGPKYDTAAIEPPPPAVAQQP